MGGADLRQAGTRTVPSLRYLQVTPQFREHYYDSDDEADASIDNGPTGGLTWDGRMDRGRIQARLPLFAANEMANPDAASVVRAVKRSPSLPLLRKAMGRHSINDTAKVFDVILQAFEAYEQTPEEFFPYSSKYDAYLSGKASLTAREARGLDLFDEPSKGNCAHCHLSARGADGTPPQFTDYGFATLAVPRNREIPANADAAYYDLGLCGPYRTDLKDHPEYCGMFKAPTLRNVALREAFFHNGVFHTLREAVAFYADRDINPGRWYPKAGDGSIQRYDDLPAQYHENINVEPPFDRKAGDSPALSEQEIDDIVVFLNTLTDGYKPQDPATARLPLRESSLQGKAPENLEIRTGRRLVEKNDAVDRERLPAERRRQRHESGKRPIAQPLLQ